MTAEETWEPAGEPITWSSYGAHLLLDPIEVPGTDCVLKLMERTKLLLEQEPEHRELGAWCARIEQFAARGSEAVGELSEEQRAIAADRTRICRGTSPAGPLPPYEAHYREDSSASDVSAAYREAGVHFDGSVERDDYLGTELAFLDYLERAEHAARTHGGEERAAAIKQQKEAFACDHLSWVGAFCAAALPHARTAYFKAALGMLASRTA